MFRSRCIRFFLGLRNKQKMSEVGSEGSEGGVILDPPSKRMRSQNGGKRWCFVWNNYPENWWAPMAPGFEGCQWLAGYEVGESGTPHIQGYVEFPKKVRPIGYKNMPKEIHWEACKGDRASNIAYVSKERNKAGGNLPWPRPLPVIELYGWQTDVQEKFESDPDNRSIFWYWSEEGRRGKSSACRWLIRQGALICSGKASDMKYLIIKYHEKNGVYPDCIVFDVPRSMENYLSYTGIEEIKNGVFASTKYECSTVEMPHPHVFVFANFGPNMRDKDMSRDRFVTVNVDEERELYPSTY